MNISLVPVDKPTTCHECDKLQDEVVCMQVDQGFYIELCEKCAVKFANNLTTLLKF